MMCSHREHVDGVLQHGEAVEVGVDDEVRDVAVDEHSPGGRPTIWFAGTRLSEQPIQRYSGAWRSARDAKNPGSAATIAAAHARLRSKSSPRSPMSSQASEGSESVKTHGAVRLRPGYPRPAACVASPFPSWRSSRSASSARRRPASALLWPGVTYERGVQFTPNGPVAISILRGPRPGGATTLEPLLSNESLLGRETLTAMQSGCLGRDHGGRER